MNKPGTNLALWNRIITGVKKMLSRNKKTNAPERPLAKIIDIESRVGLSKNPSNRNAIIKKAHEDRKRVYAFASLASVLVLVTIANLSVWSHGSKSAPIDGRGIASVSDDGSNATAQTLEEARLIYHKMETEGRAPASIGETPTLVDQLRFGLLEGKYSLRMKDGKLFEIEFVDTAQSSDRPKYIAQPEKFLHEFASILPVAYDSIEKTNETRSPSAVHQSFNLKKGDESQATVDFQHDEFGRMISMKISVKGLGKQALDDAGKAIVK